MTTLTVTKETGGKALRVGWVTVEPARQMQPEALTAMGAEAGLDGTALAYLLSAYVAHERCGVHLYRTVAGLTTVPEWQERYLEFGRQTEDHVRIYEALIEQLGGDPMFVSPQARQVEAVNGKLLEVLLLSGSLDPVTLELAGLEAVWLAELKCHANWDTLSKLAGSLPAGSIKEKMQAAVNEVQAQEDLHVQWAQQTLQETIAAQLVATR